MKNLLLVFTVIFLDTIGCGSRREHHEEATYLNVSADRLVLQSQRSEDVFEVLSNSQWTIKMVGCPWMEVSPLSGKGNSRITVTAKSPNESISDRYCAMIICCEGFEREVIVYQLGKIPADDNEDVE